MSNNEQVARHKKVCYMLNEIYEQKNRAYGNSFGDTYKDLGIISAVTRINDKFNRLKTLAKNNEINQGDESIADTLLDMANYCIMTYMELQNEEVTVYAQGGMMIDKEFVGKIENKIPPRNNQEIPKSIAKAFEDNVLSGDKETIQRFLSSFNDKIWELAEKENENESNSISRKNC